MSTPRAQYIANMKTQLDELGASMDALEADTAAALKEAKQGFQQELIKLRHEHKLAIAKYEELNASSDEAWGRLVNDMEMVRDAFIHSFNYFKSQSF